MDQEMTMGKRITTVVVSAALVAGLNPICGLVPSQRAYAQEAIAMQMQDESATTTTDWSKVTRANLSDRSADDNKDGHILLYDGDNDNYRVTCEVDDQKQSTYNVTVMAKELPWHLNGDTPASANYWTGVTVPCVKDATYKFGSAESDESALKAFTASEDDAEGLSIYFKSSSAQMPADVDGIVAANEAFDNKKDRIVVTVGGKTVATYNLSYAVAVEGSEASSAKWGDVAAANLSDRGAADNKDGHLLLDVPDYGVVTSTEEEGVTNVTVTARELPWHTNAQEVDNYWTGVTIPCVEGVTYTYGKTGEAGNTYTAEETDVEGLSMYFKPAVTEEAKTPPAIEAANAAFGNTQMTITATKGGVTFATYALSYDVTVKGTSDMNVAKTIALIDAIGLVSASQDSQNKIEAAEEAYDALTSDEKEKVTNYKTLTDARTSFETALANAEPTVPRGGNNGGGSNTADQTGSTTDQTTPTTEPTTDPTTDPGATTEPGSTTETGTTTETGATETGTTTPGATTPGTTTPGATTPGTTTPGTTTPGTEQPSATAEQPKVGDTVSDVAAGAGVTETVKVTNGSSVTATKVAVKDGGSATINTVTVGQTTYKVTEVAANALKGSNAKSITVGNNVTKIGNGALQNTKKLAKLTLGKNVKTIGKNVLKGSKVKTVTVKSSKLTKKSVKNLVKGSKVKTLKLKGVSKKAKANYKKWAPKGVTVK